MVRLSVSRVVTMYMRAVNRLLRTSLVTSSHALLVRSLVSVLLGS